MYDVRYLARKYDFDPRAVEKACRACDILEGISSDLFLRQRLSLYGGTALTLIHFDELRRLSVDLDFNYRHVDELDWGEVRSKVDEHLKRMLQLLRYTDLRVDASYPLGRITIRYVNSFGLPDRLNTEVGYMRRFPILKKDTLADFLHLGRERKVKILSPTREELFANKLIACLHRRYARDVYDVARIGSLRFDGDVMRKCAVVESLMQKGMRLDKIEPNEILRTVNLDDALRNLLRKDIAASLDFDEVKREAVAVCESVTGGLTEGELHLIKKFHEDRRFEPELIDAGEFHEKLREHPAINWVLREMAS